MRTTSILFATLATLAAGAAAAQPMANMPGMAAPTPPAAPVAPAVAAPAVAQPSIPGLQHPGASFASPSTADFRQAMDKMMHAMDLPYAGKSDQDFVTHMIPHHQGAIDMAETELKYGSDPKIKQLAARIISSQQHEIATMQAWLDKNGTAHPKTPPHAQWK